MDGLIKSEYREKCPLLDAASTLQHFFGFKIIKHQFKMAESGSNTVSYISTNDILYKTRKFLFSI